MSKVLEFQHKVMSTLLETDAKGFKGGTKGSKSIFPCAILLFKDFKAGSRLSKILLLVALMEPIFPPSPSPQKPIDFGSSWGVKGWSRGSRGVKGFKRLVTGFKRVVKAELAPVSASLRSQRGRSAAAEASRFFASAHPCSHMSAPLTIVASPALPFHVRRVSSRLPRVSRGHSLVSVRGSFV